MRSILLSTLLLLVMCSSVLAFPWVICDATTDNPTYYELVIDSGVPIKSPAYPVPGGVMLHYDLGTSIIGSHSMTVKACNEWGCSSAVPFAFTKSIPGAPTVKGLRLSTE